MRYEYVFPQLVNDFASRNDFNNLFSFPNQRIADVGYKIYHRIWLRTRLAEAQNWRCCWCGRHVTLERDRRSTVTIEHLIPRSKGGQDTFDNCVMACSKCNGKRDILSLDEYYFRLTGIRCDDIKESSTTEV